MNGWFPPIPVERGGFFLSERETMDAEQRERDAKVVKLKPLRVASEKKAEQPH